MTQFAPRTKRAVLVALISLSAGLAAFLVLASGPGIQSASAHHPVAADRLNHKQAAFHDAMRKLWEDHITWTRLAIVSFAAGSPDLGPTEARLLQNQVDIGNAVKPFYGKRAGAALTALLKTHITGAVAILGAAKSGDNAGLAKAQKDWYDNANEIAAFLHKANPRNWPLRTLRKAMKKHLDETLKEAVDRLHGNFAADIEDYDMVHHHILKMADLLSSGIIAQFPHRFR
jgi:hypothetical protein